MKATIKRMRTQEIVATATLSDGRLVVDGPGDVVAVLTIYFGAVHVDRFRDERGVLQERAIEPGSDEHFALRLDALPAVGFFAGDVER
jgi:hypothetical protein